MHTTIRILAIIITLTAAGMAAAAAIYRGGTFIEQSMLVALSVIMVLGVHLLPAISRRWSAWTLWAGCLLCAVFGHITFMTHSGIVANQVRAQQPALVAGTQRQIDAVRESLAAISARPVTVVAAELAQTDDWKARIALKEELGQARHADVLRSELVRLNGVAADVVAVQSADPVIGRIAQVTGFGEAGITLGIGMLFSVLLELVGAFLWCETMKGYPSANPPTLPDFMGGSQVTHSVTTGVTASVTHAVTTRMTQIITDAERLRSAIESGECRATVADIRAFLHCSQHRAMMLRRELRLGLGSA